MKEIIMAAIIFLLATTSFAVEETYPFQTKSQSTRFYKLTKELRCLVCQNETIAESNAALAADIRKLIYKKIQSGEDDNKIINYLVARYGNFILYKPPLTKSTLLLWFGPLIFLIIGVIALLRTSTKMRQQ